MDANTTFQELIKRQAQIDNLKILNAELLEALEEISNMASMLHNGEGIRQTAISALAKARQ